MPKYNGDPASDCYYKCLGVERDADEKAIRKAYRCAAMKYHPDKNPGDNAASDFFKKISEAYECLSDAEKRAAYDRFGKEGDAFRVPEQQNENGMAGFPNGFPSEFTAGRGGGFECTFHQAAMAVAWILTGPEICLAAFLAI